MPVTISLEGRRVLLTGAIGSLGRAQAECLAEAGAELLLLDLPHKQDGKQFAAELTNNTGKACTYVGYDLADLNGLAELVAELERDHGDIDILINNAALIENRPLEDTSVESYEEQMRINAGAAFALAKAVAPGMAERGDGRIINFCSITLNGRWTGYAPYVASKGAMLGLTKALARELGPSGIRVTAISPGAVVSEAEARVFGDKLEEYAAWVLENQCLKARIEPRHVADAILFLASPASEMMTGAVLEVTGGW